MTSLRKILRDALTRKMHALFSSVSFDDEEGKKLVQAHWEEMQRWRDLDSVCVLTYRYKMWGKEIGSALKCLLAMLSSYDAKKHLAPETVLREQLLTLYENVGWEHLLGNERRYQQMHYQKK